MVKRFMYFKPSSLNLGIPEGFSTVRYKKLLGISKIVGDKNKIILFLPDFTENFTHYNNHMEAVNNAGFDSIIYTYSGYNAPGIPSENQLIKDCKDMVVSLLDKYRLQDIILFGNGMSSFLAMYVAMEFKMDKVILRFPIESIQKRLGKYYPEFIFNEFNINKKCSSYKGSILCFSKDPINGFEKYNVQYYSKPQLNLIIDYINDT
jgi:hypothetical protein